MEDKHKEEIFQFLKSLLTKNSGYLVQEIQMNSSLNKSKYGMSSYEATLLFDKLYDKYHIKFPKDFDLRTYFPVEGFELPNFLKRIFGISSIPEVKDVNITLEHLLRVIEKREWFEPEN